MPVLERSSYAKRPWFLLNGHFETVIPSIFNNADHFEFSRERLELEDGDFLDLDWKKNENSRLLVLSHGLEGSSHRYYIKRSAKYFYERGWDILAWNCRSCSGEMNRLPRFYHHGETGDLSMVIDHAIREGRYDEIVLMGYSMGGSMSLKYLGERKTDPTIKGCVVFSVPCNLKDSGDQLALRSNRFYERRFLKKLSEKIRLKARQHPDVISADPLSEISDFNTFHEHYTIPLHGFSSLDDFYSRATCDQYLDRIEVPSLIVNAKNDPILGEKCFPIEIARESDFVFLESPGKGGHVGFSKRNGPHSWMEERSEAFIGEEILQSSR